MRIDLRCWRKYLRVIALGLLVVGIISKVNLWAFAQSGTVKPAMTVATEHPAHMGLQALNAQQYSEAEKYFKQALAESNLSENAKQAIDHALLEALEKQSGADKGEEAAKLLNQIIASAEQKRTEVNDQETLGNLYFHRAYKRFEKDNLDAASEDYLKGFSIILPMISSPTNSSSQASKATLLDQITHNISIILMRYRQLNRLDKANALFEKFQPLLNNTNNLLLKGMIEVYVQQGTNAFQSQGVQAAYPLFSKAYTLGKQSQEIDSPNWPWVLEGLGRSSYELGHYEETVKVFQELLQYNCLNPVLSEQQLTYIQHQLKQLSNLSHDDTYLRIQGENITRWDNKTKVITVYISSGKENPLWKPEWEQLLKEAFTEWQNALNNRIQFAYTESAKKYDVKVEWPIHDSKSKPVKLETELGYNLTSTWGEYLAKSDIYLYLEKGNNDPLNETEFYMTALHEIGHMLGLQVHSNHPDDIMFRSSHLAVNRDKHLSQRDIATMRSLYNQQAVISNPQGIYLSEFEKFRKKQMADLECQDAPVITLNIGMPAGETPPPAQQRLICRKKQRPTDQIPVWMPNFNF